MDKGMDRPMSGERNECTNADFQLGEPGSSPTSLIII